MYKNVPNHIKPPTSNGSSPLYSPVWWAQGASVENSWVDRGGFSHQWYPKMIDSEKPMKIHVLEVPPFQETSILHHITNKICVYHCGEHY